MTGPGRDDIRDTLAAAIDAAQFIPDAGDGYPAISMLTGVDLADALVPVVRRIAADELRAAAEAARGMHDPPAPDCVEWADWLDARAERLDPR